MSDQLQLRFFKDSVYGTAALLVFSLLGRVERYPVAVHALSLPCLVLCQALPEGTDAPAWATRAAAGACAYASVLCALADALAVLMLSCSLSACCAHGRTVAPFSLGMEVCDARSNSWDSQTVAATAIATLSAGALQSCARALSAADGQRVALAPVAYGLLRFYELSWMLAGGSMLVGSLWVAAAGAALAAAACATFASPRSPAVRALTLSALALDVSALGAGVSGASAAEQRPSLGLASGASSALAAAIAWHALGVAGPRKAKGVDSGGADPPEVGARAQSSGASAGASARAAARAKRGWCVPL